MGKYPEAETWFRSQNNQNKLLSFGGSPLHPGESKSKKNLNDACFHAFFLVNRSSGRMLYIICWSLGTIKPKLGYISDNLVAGTRVIPRINGQNIIPGFEMRSQSPVRLGRNLVNNCYNGLRMINKWRIYKIWDPFILSGLTHSGKSTVRGTFWEIQLLSFVISGHVEALPVLDAPKIKVIPCANKLMIAPDKCRFAWLETEIEQRSKWRRRSSLG